MREHEELLGRIDELNLRLREAEETLEAIRSGAVDALVVTSPGGEEQLFTLEGADSVYRTFLESIGEGALTLSDTGLILYANEAAGRLLPHESGGPVGESLRSSVRREDRERFDALFDAARERSSGAELLLRGPAGGRPVYLSLRPLASQVGKVVVGVVTDLAERKKTEKALEAERLANSILAQTSEAIVVCDTTGVVIRAGRSVTELAGRDPLFRRFDDVLPLRTPDGRRWLLSGLLGTARSVHRREVQIERPDGRLSHLLMNADPLRTEGDLVGIVITLTDVSELKTVEDALRASEEKYRTLFDDMEEGFAIGEVVRDEQGRIVDHRFLELNPALEKQLGLLPYEVLGRPADDVYPRLDLWWTETFRRVVETGQAARFEHHDEQSGRWYDTSVLPRERDGFAVLYNDITERKRTEEEKRLAGAQKAAEAERSRLARDLHDSVTQALFAASLKAESLTVDGVVSGKARGVVEDVDRLTRGALAQMRTMLLELRGEGIEQIPLRQLLRTVAEATEGRCSAKVSLAAEGDGELPDEVHVALYRITQEALNNVAKHARAENAWVSLTVEPSQARLVIGDDGCGFRPGGMDPSHMGLASMRERAREAGADFSVSSEPGEGTVVRVVWRKGASAPPGG